jgi:hypothetical protein
MPLYEFRCEAGHVTEALCPIGTAQVPCGRCPILLRDPPIPQYATRILSPTRTTFEFADQRRKRSIE